MFNKLVLNISVIPVYDGVSYSQLAKTYQLKIDHIYSSLNHINIENSNGEINANNIIYMSDEYKLIATPDSIAAFLTASATALPTLGSKAWGRM